MDNRDRALLLDIRNLIAINRVATAQTLYSGLTHLNDITLATMEALGEYASATSLAEEVDRSNEASRIETILIAKIYAEQIAAWEDLGALGFAIRHRNSDPTPTDTPAGLQGGIFHQYLKSTTADAANFYDNIRSGNSGSPITTLDKWLNLPGIEQLRGQIPDDKLASVQYDYTQQPIPLLEVAKHYRRTATEIQQISSGSSGPVDWRDKIYIQLGFPDPNKPSRVFTNAFNKIKHRFMVVEDPTAYGSSVGINPEYALLRWDPEYVNTMITHIIGAARIMQELASLMYGLDQAGVEL